MTEKISGNNPEKKKKRKTAKKNVVSVKVWVCGFVVFLIVMSNLGYILGLVGFHFVYSEGERIGQVIKLSNKGVIWRTWEGSMGLTQSGAYVENWHFSVDSKDSDQEEIVQQLRAAQQTGQLVRVRYTQRMAPLYWRGKTAYLIDEVSPARS